MSSLQHPVSRRRVLQLGGLAIAAAVLDAACGTSEARTPAPSGASRASGGPLSTPAGSTTPSALPPLAASDLTNAASRLAASGSLGLPGGGSASVADLTSAAEAFAAGDAMSPMPERNPVAALGLVLAVADWSGASGPVELGATFPGLDLVPVRLPLVAAAETVPGATPPGLVVHQETALTVAGLGPDGTLVGGLADPARTVAGHPRLELVLLTPDAAGRLLATAGARLAGGAILPGSGAPIALRSLAADLAARLAQGAGVLFVDAAPIQPPRAKTRLLTADPVVPPPPATIAGVARVAQAKDGRVLALDAGGKAVGRAQYIGAATGWNWLSRDGLALALREEAQRIGWDVGSELTDFFRDPATRPLYVAQLNHLTIGWGVEDPSLNGPVRSRSDFPPLMLNQIASVAPYGFGLRFHPIIGKPEGRWLRALNAGSARAAIQTWVGTVVEALKDSVREFVVVNEPYLLPWRPNDLLYDVLGYDYIDIAFAAAREADPSAVLLYNDTENHTRDGLTTALTRATVSRLKGKKLIDGVGLQMHLDGSYPPAPEDVVTTMRSYGVPAYVTEFDIDLSTMSGTTASRFATQAQIAGAMVQAIRSSGVCSSFTLWGVSDTLSWLTRSGYPRSDATPWDGQLRPKPFLAALLEAFA